MDTQDPNQSFAPTQHPLSSHSGYASPPESDDRYSTVNLYEAAFIWAHGYDLSIVPLSPTKRRFDFPPEGRLAATEFMRNTAIPARLYASFLRDLKSLIARPA